jgi:hypothetical protein
VTRNRLTDLIMRYPFSVLYLLACIDAVLLALILEWR